MPPPSGRPAASVASACPLRGLQSLYSLPVFALVFRIKAAPSRIGLFRRRESSLIAVGSSLIAVGSSLIAVGSSLIAVGSVFGVI